MWPFDLMKNIEYFRCKSSSAVEKKGPAPPPPHIQGSSVDPSPSRPTRPPRIKSQNSYPKTTSSKFFKQLPAFLGGGDKKDVGSADMLSSKNPKQPPGLESGFLVMV